MSSEITWASGKKLTWAYYYLVVPIEMQCYVNVGPGKPLSTMTWTLPKGQLVRIYTGQLSGATSPSKHLSDTERLAIERCPLIGAYWSYYPNGIDREQEKGFTDTELSRYTSQIGWSSVDPNSLIPASTYDLPVDQIDACGGDVPVPKKWWTKDSAAAWDPNQPETPPVSTPVASSSWLPVAAIVAAGLWFYMRRK